MSHTNATGNGDLVEREWTDEMGTHYEAKIELGDRIVSKIITKLPEMGWMGLQREAREDVFRVASQAVLPEVSGFERSMTDPPDTFQRAIGDLNVARRHLERIRMGALPAGPMVLNEVQQSVLRCVARLERMGRA